MLYDNDGLVVTILIDVTFNLFLLEGRILFIFFKVSLVCDVLLKSKYARFLLTEMQMLIFEL